MAKDKEEKPKMSKGKKIIAGLLVALTIAGAAVGAAIAITNSLNNTQGNAGPGTSFGPNPDRYLDQHHLLEVMGLMGDLALEQKKFLGLSHWVTQHN